MQATTDFSKKVLSFIKKIPRGKVATYGQIAALAGKPQGSRGVAWLLHSCSESHQLPWQRVLNSKGKISFPPGTAEFKKQKKLLESEGVEFSDSNQIDMKRFQWKQKARVPAKDLRRPTMFSGR
ncbi:MGMT family protein [Bdellovibrio bacteriovorus]|uniref:MGMT family protein n=1 Tax=Bdellovibrio bacteriovorus TaxID=959 RepID=UPI0021CF74B4|nr:MGMT family protein [Bdellovibrio bacteriovorus]UXR65957.1 MGMT family protein [Bdellovibrio bacteriovorus]